MSRYFNIHNGSKENYEECFRRELNFCTKSELDRLVTIEGIYDFRLIHVKESYKSDVVKAIAEILAKRLENVRTGNEEKNKTQTFAMALKGQGEDFSYFTRCCMECRELQLEAEKNYGD